MKELDKEIAEGTPLARRFTIHGEHIIRFREGGNYETMDIPAYEGEQLEPRLHTAMWVMWDAIMQIKTKLPKRQLPLTRMEYMKADGVDKSVIQKLIKLDLIQEHLIDVIKSGKRACVYPTELGRGYFRKYFDANYLQASN